jgi:hypothetical protein
VVGDKNEWLGLLDVAGLQVEALTAASPGSHLPMTAGNTCSSPAVGCRVTFPDPGHAAGVGSLTPADTSFPHGTRHDGATSWPRRPFQKSCEELLSTSTPVLQAAASGGRPRPAGERWGGELRASL